MRLKKSWLGDFTSFRAMLRKAAMAMATFSLPKIHLEIRDFKFFPAISANPLDSGLYADASLCLMLFALHYSENSPRNCGPPSILM